MANALDQAKDTALADAIGKTKVGEAEPEAGKVGVKVKAAIFFDGTGNNQSNIKKRRQNPSYMKPGWFQSDSDYESYAQSYSNVALLFFLHQKKRAGERIVSVYMPGIGTSNDGKDDTPGGAFGTGPTGIVARVNDGITEVASKVKRLVKQVDNEYLQELTVYVFGFSRGAAAARHFCARRADSQGRKNNLCRELGVAPAVVTLKFVGLFETVSSFHDDPSKPPELDTDLGKKLASHAFLKDSQFQNDVPELHLTLDDPTLVHAVQLRAADEYRVNFSATNIDSALRTGKGYELVVPGAHSDVGGGYTQPTEEVREYGDPVAYKQCQYFQQQGWYGPGQVTTSMQDGGQDEKGRPLPKVRLLTGKRTVPNSYQYVTLSMMLKLAAAANSGIVFAEPTAADERTITHTVTAPARLVALKGQLEKYALSTFPGGGKSLTAPIATADYHWLRQHYLHLSWSSRLGMNLRVDETAFEARQQKVYAAEEQAAKARPPGSPLPPMAPPLEDDSYLPTRLVLPG